MKTMNILEIITNKSEAQIYAKPYKGNWQELRQLRKQYPHLTFHQWNNQETEEHLLYCWSSTENYEDLPNTFKTVTINSQTHSNIWCKILEDGFIRLMKSRGRKVYYKKYSHVREIELSKDKTGYVGNGIKDIPRLKVSFHYLLSQVSNKVNFYMSVRKAYLPKLTYTDAEYKYRKIDTRGWSRSEIGELINNRSNIKKLLAATGEARIYQNYRNNIESDTTSHKFLSDYHHQLNSIVNKIPIPNGLQINEFLLTNIPNTHIEVLKINKPQYYFYNNATGSGLYNDRIKKLKPSSYDIFKNKKVKILVLTPKEHEGTVGSFSTELLNILSNTFHIRNISQELMTFNPKEAYAYSNLLKRLDLDNVDLVLQVVSESDKKKVIKKSPYFVFKAKLINQKTPCQSVLVKTIRQNNSQVKAAIALNIYTKLGGTAWTIEKDRKDKAEIIIGISSTVDSKKNRIMGFANVLDYRGTFLTGECTQLSDIDSYSKKLENHLIDIIGRVIRTKNISVDEPFRLIFHLTKSAGKKSELRAIENALKKFYKYSIQFGIVHLSYNHNYRIYQDNGKSFPERGSFVKLSYNQALLHLGKPTKTPILIRRDYRSNYDDLEDMSKHILHFAHLSHRSYRPASRPVTIQYPSIMAKLVGELNKVPDWDKSMIDKLQERLWFI